ncbi:hypothetical protein A2W24_01070 [Microgenomates group bacterium RBG_16_45_19]|nr:MAG: hypothetical protein A2W24_01070 [Microgenomates group bacterium RBG_16_45_19]
MATAVQTKIIKGFNAVDLVTVAVFAALYRAAWYVWQIFGFLFPFNIVLATFFATLAAVAAAVIVRKVGVFTLYAIAAALINFFFQGEALVASIIYLFLGVFSDAYLYMQIKAGKDPFTSFRDMAIAGGIFAFLWSAVNWGYVFPILFQMEFSIGMLFAVAVSCFVGGVIGGLIGYKLGDRLKGLIY